MTMHGCERFFAYARERYRVMLRRETGQPAPWTDDPILRQYRFCNVFREDDRVTRWIAENVRRPLRRDPRVLLAMYIARWFNRIPTLERLEGRAVSNTNLFLTWNRDYAERRLRDVKPLVTGAYMVKTPAGKNKLEGVLECIEAFVPHAERVGHEMLAARSLQHATELLQQFPYMGPFMAYEVVTDLRHTYLLDQATDILSWANPGPGAARGLGRVLYGEPERFDRHVKCQVDEMQEAMQMLLARSRDPLFWPSDWPKWEMREVEHTLCEFDKYERARLGEGTPKQRYNGG